MSLLSNYEASSFHQWWVDNVWKPSWTKVVTFVYGIPALVVAGFQALAAFGNDSTISNYLSQLNVPNWVPMGLAGIALVHYIAHGRE